MENRDPKHDEAPTWGISIPVDNVQEMVRNNPSFVPERYLRNHDDRPDIHPSPTSSDVPIIDLSLLSDGNTDELKKLEAACIDWGFFHIINHGVSEQVLLSMKDSASKFFKLPFQEKNQYEMPSNDVQGYGHAYVVSEEQKLDWGDQLVLVVYPTRFRKLECWPKAPPELMDVIESYSNEINKTAKRLLGCLSLMMGMDKDRLLEMHEEVMQTLGVNYYPPCSKPEHVLGLSPHSDTSSITILMQDNGVTGLQILHSEEWVSVKPVPNALVVNIGDVIEILSNGKYKSIEHRAVTNKDVPRMSFATFITPNQDVEIQPIDQMVDIRNSVKLYQKIKFGEYLRNSLKNKLQGKEHTKIAKLET